MVIAPRIEHGTRALFKCKDGFQLVGPNTTECMYGNWSEAMPVCQESKSFAHPKFQLVTRRASELQFFGFDDASKSNVMLRVACRRMADGW
jgi:hypothetical protein